MIITSCVTVEEKKEVKIVGDEDKQDNAQKASTYLSLPLSQNLRRPENTGTTADAFTFHPAF